MVLFPKEFSFLSKIELVLETLLIIKVVESKVSIFLPILVIAFWNFTKFKYIGSTDRK